MDKKIYTREARDFGQVFGATFGYVKQNFKSLFGSVILYTVPFITLIAAIAAYGVSAFSSGSSFFAADGLPNIGNIVLLIFLLMILFLVVNSVYTVTVNRHLIINESLPQDQFTKIGDIGSSFFDSYWRVLGNIILLGLLAMVVMIIYSIMLALIVAGVSALGIVGVLFGFIIQMANSFIVSPMLAFTFFTAIFVVQRDKVGIMTALSKVFGYLKGNFWYTWLTTICGYFMTNIMTVIIALPIIIFIVIAVVSRVKYDSMYSPTEGIGDTTIIIGAALFIFTIGLGLCVTALFYLICIFQYTSLEEKKEGKSIIEKINEL